MKISITIATNCFVIIANFCNWVDMELTKNILGTQGLKFPTLPLTSLLSLMNHEKGSHRSNVKVMLPSCQVNKSNQSLICFIYFHIRSNIFSQKMFKVHCHILFPEICLLVCDSFSKHSEIMVIVIIRSFLSYFNKHFYYWSLNRNLH